jgi:hypothetical protein
MTVACRWIGHDLYARGLAEKSETDVAGLM